MTQGRSREEQIKQDVHDLHRLGYAQELFRSMGGFSNFAISFSIISILTGAVILYDYGLAWAGTAAVIIGWPLVTLFVLFIAASMGEIASAYPTAGGLYYWASKMKNKAWGWWTASAPGTARRTTRQRATRSACTGARSSRTVTAVHCRGPRARAESSA